MRRLALIGLSFFSALAVAQAPDVKINLDARLNYRSAPNDPNTQRLYDSLGRYSLVSLSFTLEPGFRVFVSEKLQRFDGGRDRDILDEYYIEDEGIWRAGKQYLPFGAGTILRESVFALRGDTNLIFEDLPISVAYAQGSSGRQSGLVGRVGGRLGLSAFYGEHFGIDGTSLALIRMPDQAGGIRSGYKQAFGIDYSRNVGKVALALEAVAFRQPNLPSEKGYQVVDLSATYAPSTYQTYSLGWTRRTEPNTDFWRARASFVVTRNCFLEPMVRYRDGEVFDFNLSIRFRL
ncbi:MAG: hypothetical protein IT203_09970 [Fimbriimonadaceae bacterium]|nr:hypothetical protein [Fimbriimonadaceae bacterium]